MNLTSNHRVGNLIPSDWTLSALRSIRDRLQALDADALLDARDDLAVALSEAIGGLMYDGLTPNQMAAEPTPIVPLVERNMLDGIADDFEVTDDDPAAWPAWTTTEPTPISALAAGFELPALSGGSPEAYEPTDADWSDYHAYCELQDSLDMQEDAHRCGMAS
jgi:hypothetical protein